MLGQEQLAALLPKQWSTQLLRLQAHAQQMSLSWAIESAWHALADARDSGQEAELPQPTRLAHTVLVWRIELSPQWRSLTDDEREALALLAAETPLADWLTERGQANLPQSVAYLQRWALEGLLVT
jgi:hypothetical protein